MANREKISTISIHAPAKGATDYLLTPSNFPVISIHAPAKGATYSFISSAFKNANFNPRSREGSDIPGTKNETEASKISIHAPAKGATVYVLTSPTSSGDFNPRSREGSDCTHIKPHNSLLIFQSTLPRRERRNSIFVTRCYILFQSTLPRRERRNGSNFLGFSFQFQSTLPRRERPLIPFIHQLST